MHKDFLDTWIPDLHMNATIYKLSPNTEGGNKQNESADTNQAKLVWADHAVVQE